MSLKLHEPMLVLLGVLLVSGCGGCRSDGSDSPKELAEFSFKMTVATRVSSVAFSPDGKMLAAGLHIGAANEPGQIEGAAYVWETASHKERIVLNQKDYVNTVSFSPDGKLLAVACGRASARDKPPIPGEVRVYSVPDFKEKTKLKHKGGVLGLKFSPDGATMATVSYDDLPVRIWDVSTASEKLAIKASVGSGDTIAFSPDGKQLVVGGGADSGIGTDNGVVKSYDAATGKNLGSFTVQRGMVTSLVFCPDGKTLFVYTDQLGFWDVASGEEVKVHKFPPPTGGYGNGVGTCFSQNGKTLALSGNMGGTSPRGYAFIALWDFESGKQQRYWKVERSVLPALAFSPDGKTLAAGGTLGVKLWDLSK